MSRKRTSKRQDPEQLPLITPPPPVTWTTQAPCAETAERARDTNAADAQATLRALDVCFSCPVVSQCYEWARSEKDFSGVAGYAVWPENRRRPGHLTADQYRRKNTR